MNQSTMTTLLQIAEVTEKAGSFWASAWSAAAKE